MYGKGSSEKRKPVAGWLPGARYFIQRLEEGGCLEGR